MGTKRKYASSKEITKNPISFEMVEEKVKAMQPGRKIKIWVPRNKTQDNENPYRIVKGTVVKIYENHIQIFVKTKRGAKYNECFLKRDLYHWKFEVR